MPKKIIVSSLVLVAFFCVILAFCLHNTNTGIGNTNIFNINRNTSTTICEQRVAAQVSQPTPNNQHIIIPAKKTVINKSRKSVTIPILEYHCVSNSIFGIKTFS